MTPAIDRHPFLARESLPTAWSRRLLSILPRLVRRRLLHLDPHELPPHLLRDLGLADQGFRSCRADPWLR